jgi:hypothetical protein
MACNNVTTLLLMWGGYSAAAVGEVFIPAGPWLSASNLVSAKGWGELRGKLGNFQAKPAVQVANDVRSPGASTAVGPAITADGVSDPSGNVAVTAGTSKYVRPGWLVSLTAAGSLSTGNLAGQIDLIYG